MNLNKLVRFDHLTDDGRLNKVYTIILAVIFIIIFIFTIWLWPGNFGHPLFGIGVLGVIILMCIEIALIVAFIQGCWIKNWGKKYLKMRSKFKTTYEREDNT